MSTKSDENRVRRETMRKGYLLCKSRSRDPFSDDYGLYVLVDNCRGNRLPAARAPYAAFSNGEGMTLADAEAVLQSARV